MLDALVSRLAKGGSYTISDLAQELGVGEGLVQQMIEDLVSFGYLSRLTGSCGQNCGQCSLSGGCCVGGRGQAWQLTDKGRRAAVSKGDGGEE